MFRPQFPLPPACPGHVWQPCLYQFDSTNTDAFTDIVLTSGQQSGYIPLVLDDDAPFVLLAMRIQSSELKVQVWDQSNNELSDDYVLPSEFASDFPPATVLEGPGIQCLRGSVFKVRLQGI